MSYKMLNIQENKHIQDKSSLKGAALHFIRESCENLRYDAAKVDEPTTKMYTGTSMDSEQIPFNMQMDIDRLCLENAVKRFLESGKKADAFDVYFCYLEMFVGDYAKTRRMIELLSEFEANGSGLLMKHRDHYSHSVYVFCLGLAIYESNCVFREKYKAYFNITDECEAASHYLKYWGLSALFHDIGYPFELPFEQVCSYFEVNGDKRGKRPYVAYHALDDYVKFNKSMQRKIGELYHLGTDKMISSTEELFAYVIYHKLGTKYYFSEKEMLDFLKKKPTEPNNFGHFMDHAYFSATVLFKKMFEEMNMELTKEYVDALTAIILHNSLYKFSIAYYKDPVSNIRLKAENHPLAYMLMLCDELQCWDRTAYGRNSKHELHPMDCEFDLSSDSIKATYIFDIAEEAKINNLKSGKIKKLKAYDAYVQLTEICRDDGSKEKVSKFQADIENIVDLSQIKLNVNVKLKKNEAKGKAYISDSSYISLYNFAIVLNGRWGEVNNWKKAKKEERIEEFLADEQRINEFAKSFSKLSLEYKLSNINQAKAFAKYMDMIGCFYTDKPVDFEMVESFREEELIKIGPLEHQRWLQEHYDMGWTYGNPEESERELLRQHKSMIPGADGMIDVKKTDAEDNYNRLDMAEQDKDTDAMECMLALLKMYDGLRVYRL